MLGEYEVKRLEAPVTVEERDSVFTFWRRFFESTDEDFRDVYTGAEIECNRHLIYLVRWKERLVGTAHLTISRTDPFLGGLGGVAIDPELRGRGIATRLCKLVWEDFKSWDGRALFLGTSNPIAARIYRHCGWQRLANTNVMVRVAGRNSPESFFVEYFRCRKGRVSLVEPTPAETIPMIPLIVSPHDWQVMDANVNIFSIRYTFQKSCTGLYPKYDNLLILAKGKWFGARVGKGCLVGLATARLDESGRFQVDGFVHQNFASVWKPLIQKAVNWSADTGAKDCCALVSAEDEEKISLFESLQFRKREPGKDFLLDGVQVHSFYLIRHL